MRLLWMDFGQLSPPAPLPAAGKLKYPHGMHRSSQEIPSTDVDGPGAKCGSRAALSRVRPVENRCILKKGGLFSGSGVSQLREHIVHFSFYVRVFRHGLLNGLLRVHDGRMVFLSEEFGDLC